MTDNSIEKLRLQGVSDNIIQQLSSLKNKDFPLKFWKERMPREISISRNNLSKIINSLEISDDFFYWSVFFQNINKDSVFIKPHGRESNYRYWQSYTSIQIMKSIEICRVLADKFQIQNIIGYENILPSILAPGPAFPIELVKTKALNH